MDRWGQRSCHFRAAPRDGMMEPIRSPQKSKAQLLPNRESAISDLIGCWMLDHPWLAVLFSVAIPPMVFVIAYYVVCFFWT